MKKELDESWVRDVEAHFREAVDIAKLEDQTAEAVKFVMQRRWDRDEEHRKRA